MAAWGRDGPQIGHGQVWRIGTSLLVQDGGWFATLLNVVGLVVLGGFAEQVCARSRWATAYAVAGLTGELVGWAGWQPVGAGNSVAVCGLAALLAVTLAGGGHARWQPSGGVAAGIWGPVLLAGAVLSDTVVAVGSVVLVALGRASAHERWPAALSAGRVAAVLRLSLPAEPSPGGPTPRRGAWRPRRTAP